MEWNEEMQTALRAWLAPETAHTEHPLDNARFYQFVAQVWRIHQGTWDEVSVKERIRTTVRDLHPAWPEDLIAEIVDTRRQQGTLILEFLTSIRGQGKINTLIPQ